MSARFLPAGFSPTEEQLEIQTHPHHSLLIQAAAGAAKTTTLALRINEHLAAGLAPRSLLALTYTETACLALRRSLARQGVDAEALRALRIETFETFAAKRLRPLEAVEGRDPVQSLRTLEQLREPVWEAVQTVALDPAERHREALVLPALGTDSNIAAYLRQFRRIKGSMLLEMDPLEGPSSPEAAEDRGLDYSLLRVLLTYERLRRQGEHGSVAFRGPHDACYDLARLLLEEAEAGLVGSQALSLGRFAAVFVDEMHDCNRAMFTILKALLADPRTGFCGVGDRDQVIHQEQGADAGFMDQALTRETGRKILRPRLSRSFRYGTELAQWMGKHTAKRIVSEPGLSTALCPYSYEDGQAEDQLIAALQDWRRERRSERAWAESTVLLRHESQSVLIENALHRAGIAYRCAGFASYLQRPEVLFVRAVYAIASERWDTLGGRLTRQQIPAALFEMTQTPPLDAEQAEQDAGAFVREAGELAADSPQVIHDILHNHVMTRAPAGMRRRLAAALAAVRSAPQDGCSFADFLKALDMPGLAREVFVDPERRAELGRHMRGLLACSARGGVAAFFRQLHEQDLALEEKQRVREERGGGSAAPREAAVRLASVSHVKGLEFEHVLMPYLGEGQFPDAKAVLAEERNLFYVGATRARQRLSLLVPRGNPSRFVKPLINDQDAGA